MEKQLNSAIITDFKITTRMCIGCRGKYPQKYLYRFQEKDGKLVGYTKSGRSFYICNQCISQEKKRLIKILNCKFKIKQPSDILHFCKESDTDESVKN